MGKRQKTSGRINEEHVCIDSFIQHLREIDTKQEIICQEEPNDPPDFWVTIAKVTYAVEVTSIVDDYGYDALCKKLLEAIRSEFLKSKDIIGTYALVIMRQPSIPKRGTTSWNELVSTAITKIHEMVNDPNGTKFNLFQDINGYLQIVKLSDQSTVIGFCRTPVMKWELEVHEELTRLISERIEKKRERLKDTLHRCSNVILLLYDAYGYSYVEDMQKAFLKIRGYEWLHSIYLAASFSNVPNILYPDSPGRKGVFLYSKNKLWQ